jgi:hypothetical protein
VGALSLDTAALPVRVAQLAVQAAGFVEARLGETLPPTRIVVASRIGLALLATRTAAATVGAPVRWRRRARYAVSMWRTAVSNGIACTLLAPDGVLIIVTRGALTDPYLPDYLVHELTHAVQYGRPGRREQLLAELADVLGAAPQAEADEYAAYLQQHIDEGEAYRVQAEHAGVVGAETPSGGRQW